MSTTMKVGIAGSTGRMGRALLDAVFSDKEAQLAAALEQPGHAALGKDAGEFVGSPCRVLVSADVDAALADCDVLIDFTRPEATRHHIDVCVRRGVRMVIGTTGFDPEQKAIIAEAARAIPIVFAPNMSVATNLVFKLAEVSARVLGDGYDVEIIEAHHRHKVDAPSGTALHIGQILAKALGRDLDQCAVYDRKGITGERNASAIGFATVRGGDIVGEHTVLFAGTGERVEVTVRATSRATYAQGAVRAARFLMEKKAGLFDMQDVLGLR
jgi:4-hydroxy-tetrahydrodipicolinate reductase